MLRHDRYTVPDSAKEVALSCGSPSNHEVVLCAGCGAAIGGVKFVKMVSSLLGTKNESMKYCPSCKQRLVFESLAGGERHEQS